MQGGHLGSHDCSHWPANKPLKFVVLETSLLIEDVEARSTVFRGSYDRLKRSDWYNPSRRMQPAKVSASSEQSNTTEKDSLEREREVYGRRGCQTPAMLHCLRHYVFRRGWERWSMAGPWRSLSIAFLPLAEVQGRFLEMDARGTSPTSTCVPKGAFDHGGVAVRRRG